MSKDINKQESNLSDDQILYEIEELRKRITRVEKDDTEQKVSEKDIKKINSFAEIKESQQMFQMTFEQAAVGIAHVAPDGQFIRINQKFCDIVGYNLEELTARTFRDITHPDDLATDIEYYKQMLAKEIETYSMEKRYLHKDNSIVWVNLIVSLVLEDNGDPKYFIAVVEDITKRVEAEDKFKLLVEQAGDAFFILDYEGAIYDVNQQACLSLGYTREEILGMNISEVDTIDHMQKFWKTLKPGQHIIFEGTHRRKDGSIFSVEVSLSRLDLREKNLLLALARDITDRKKKEEELKKHAKFQELVSKISTKFSALSGFDLETAIHNALGEIGKYFNSDTVRLYRLSLKGEVVKIRNMWRDERLAPPKEMLEIHKLKYPNLAKHYSNGEATVFSNYEESPEWPEMRKILKFFGTKAGVGVPIEIDESGVDIFAMDKVHSEHIWPLDIVVQSKIIGRVLLSAMRRREAEIQIQEHFDEVKSLKDQLEVDNIYLHEEIKLNHNYENIIGESRDLQYALHRVEKIAPTGTTVLILGETGTGKELFARAIHDASPFANRPIIKVNCATLPKELIESELFGHEKGAFTGAIEKRIGRFELANGTTIFLDEIGELPLELQPKLLRILQEGEFERLGSSKTIKVNVRVIAATNRNLEEEVQQGRFRLDLYYRVKVFPITVPPLRKRKEDIPLLLNYIVKKHCRKLGIEINEIPQRTLDSLQKYSWPGNIRELENVIESAIITSQSHVLHVELPTTSILQNNVEQSLEEVERDHIVKILNLKNWRIEGSKGAAVVLNMNPATLRSRMQKLGIEKPRLGN